MAITTRGAKFLGDKTCFLVWFEMSSLPKAAEYLKKAGVVNPRTGRSPSPMAVHVAAFRWILEHPDEAREYYNLAGSTMNDDEWAEFLVVKAKGILGRSSRDRFLRWVIKYDMQKYSYLFPEYVMAVKQEAQWYDDKFKENEKRG